MSVLLAVERLFMSAPSEISENILDQFRPGFKPFSLCSWDSFRSFRQYLMELYGEVSARRSALSNKIFRPKPERRSGGEKIAGPCCADGALDDLAVMRLDE